MGSSKAALVALLGLSFVLASCSMGSMDDARAIYWKHREIFHAMDAEIHSQPPIARVEDIYDPYDERSVRFMTTFGPFNEETKKVYKALVAQMADAEVRSIVVARGPGNGGAYVEVVDFIIFGRGLGANTEGISIMAGHSTRPGKIDPHCSAIEPPVWLVCHWK